MCSKLRLPTVLEDGWVFMGALMLGACFMVAAPVSASGSLRAAVSTAVSTAGPTPGRAVEAQDPASREAIDASSQLGLPLDPEQMIQLVWEGGRPVEPGLSRSRRAEREQERVARCDGLRELTGASLEARAEFIEIVRGVLQDDSTPEPLASAALRIVGELRLTSLAELVIARLQKSDGTSLVARGALHDLYGVWFVDAEASARFRDALAQAPISQAYLRELESFEARERAYLIELARATPTSIGFEHLDPSLRADLADTLLKTWIQHATEDQVGLARELGQTAFEALSSERDGLAFASLLDLTLAMYEAGAVSTERWDALVLDLEQLQVSSVDERSLTIARALARIPWAGLEVAAEQSSSHDFEGGLARIGRTLDGLLSRVRWPQRPDPDVIVGVLDALGAMSDRVRNAEHADRLSTSAARESLFRLIEDRDAGAVSRAASVGTLRRFVAPGDGPRLVAVLEVQQDAPQLVHAVLGCLGSLLVQYGVSSEGTDGVLAQVASWTLDEDPDLRRQALSLLENEQLAPLSRRIPVTVLVESIGSEEFGDIAAAKLRLVTRLGTPLELPALLELGNFDQLVAGTPTVFEALFGALRTLSNGSTQSRFRVARRLLAVEHPESQLARLRQALMIAGAEQADQVTLGVPEHRDLVAWGWELFAAGVDLESISAGFATRLATDHLPALENAELGPELRARRAHLMAILLSRSAPLNSEATREQFELALTAAAQVDGSRVGFLARRDRARFFDRTGAPVEALGDLRALIDNGVLSNADHRLAVELLGRDPATFKQVAPEAFDWLSRLVQRTSWRSETAGVRWQDLDALGLWASRAAEPIQLWKRLDLFYADLPETEVIDPSLLESALWAGLEREENGLERLREWERATREGMTPAASKPEPVDEVDSGSAGDAQNESNKEATDG